MTVNKCLPEMWRKEADETERVAARKLAEHPTASESTRVTVLEMCRERAETFRLCASQLERGLALDEEIEGRALAAVAVGDVS